MIQQTSKIPISSIILNEEIYPRKGIDHRRVGIFSENIRDGFRFDPIEVEPCPAKPDLYRLLDGAHRWSAYKSTGVEEVKAVIKDLDGNDPLGQDCKEIGPGWLGHRSNTICRKWQRCQIRQMPIYPAGSLLPRWRKSTDDLILDPMAGGGVTPDTCLAMDQQGLE